VHPQLAKKDPDKQDTSRPEANPAKSETAKAKPDSGYDAKG
jgi:hypothetical protein